MQEFISRLTLDMGKAFAAAGYEEKLGKVTVSNRPDLCEFQCNGAMAAAKQYHKAPLVIAQEVASKLAEDTSVFSSAEAVAPGFLNLRVREEFLVDYLTGMAEDAHFGYEKDGSARKIVLDYGGPNVAKPLHVGHLRSAVIGESIKRILRYSGDEVTGDIHLGDWGLQMGLVITELKRRMPGLPYYDESFQGVYPEEAPFTVGELEEIYPFASKKSKEDEAYYKEAMEYTHRLQNGEKGLRELWKKIVEVSTRDMKRNYSRLQVSFDLWNGESTVQEMIAPMVEKMKADGLAYESNGALIVDVAKEEDTKEIPPCMILKSDGAALYTTTDLATIEMREKELKPEEIIYVTDKRQELHFTQVFRCAEKCGLSSENTKLRHIGFGTVNGKDGHALKTRDGGVMRLETLIDDIEEAMLGKISQNADITREEAENTSRIVALAALKYGDLSNQAAKDYVFDMDKFTSFEGDTGPYILYTMVRMKSILKRYEEGEHTPEKERKLLAPQSSDEKKLMQTLAGFSAMLKTAYADLSPARICAFVYQLSNDFNSFYHGTRILTEENRERKDSWITLLGITLGILETCIDLLGFSAPERM